MALFTVFPVQESEAKELIHIDDMNKGGGTDCVSGPIGGEGSNASVLCNYKKRWFSTNC